jgi:hypothetical protein
MPWPVGIPKTLNDEQRTERARKAALARTTTDHHIKSLIGKPLTIEQKTRLAGLLYDDPDTDSRTEGAGV